jgi:hypothetical protein
LLASTLEIYGGVMRTSKLFLILSLSMFLFVCGCGDKDVRGTLTVSDPAVTNSETFSKVSFTITYSNPTAPNVGGVEVDVVTSFSAIAGTFTQETLTLNNNGTNSASVTLSFFVPRSTDDKTFTLSASTGSLNSSSTAIIPKLGAPATTPLTLLPSAITFTATAPVGSTQTVTISGGSGSYSVLNINPSPNPNISASITGSTLTVTKTSSASGGSATILIGDSATPPASATLTVNY